MGFMACLMATSQMTAVLIHTVMPGDITMSLAFWDSLGLSVKAQRATWVSSRRFRVVGPHEKSQNFWVQNIDVVRNFKKPFGSADPFSCGCAFEGKQPGHGSGTPGDDDFRLQAMFDVLNQLGQGGLSLRDGYGFHELSLAWPIKKSICLITHVCLNVKKRIKSHEHPALHLVIVGYKSKRRSMIRHIIFKVVGKCNLACPYCYYMKSLDEKWNKKFSPSRLEEIFRKISESTDKIKVSWHGGEPTLVGIDFYKSATEAARKARVKVRHSIQTNGLLINDEWCSFFKENDFHVGVSIDGPPDLHNKLRPKNLTRECRHMTAPLGLWSF